MIEKWTSTSPPPTFDYLPPAEFGVRLRSLRLDSHATEQVARDYCDAALIVRILDGGMLSEAKHRLAYGWVVGSSQGTALGLSARIAVQTGGSVLEAFTVSTWLDGFEKALNCFTSRFWKEGFNWREELRWVMGTVLTQDDQVARFWLRSIEAKTDSAFEFVEESSKAFVQAAAAKRMSELRGAKTRSPVYKQAIALYWIAAALWARTDAGIVALLDPDSMTAVKAADRVRRDIHEIGFSASRRPDHEKTLDKSGHSGAS